MCIKGYIAFAAIAFPDQRYLVLNFGGNIWFMMDRPLILIVPFFSAAFKCSTCKLKHVTLNMNGTFILCYHLISKYWVHEAIIKMCHLLYGCQRQLRKLNVLVEANNFFFNHFSLHTKTVKILITRIEPLVGMLSKIMYFLGCIMLYASMQLFVGSKMLYCAGERTIGL